MCAVSVFVYSGDRTELWKTAISIIHRCGDGTRGVWYGVTASRETKAETARTLYIGDESSLFFRGFF